MKALERRSVRGSLRIALEETRLHPWRTLLVCQGMVWAVALVIVPAAILEGTREQAGVRAGELGTDRIEVTADATGGAAFRPREGDLPGLAEALPAGSRVTALRAVEATSVDLPERRLWLLGCDRELLDARGARLLAGRFPDLEEPRAGDPVEVALEARLARSILGEEASSLDDVLGTVWHLDRSGRPRMRIYGTVHETGSARPGGKANALVALRVVGVVADESSSKVDQFGNDKTSLFAQDILELARIFGIVADQPSWLRLGLGVYVPRRLVPGEAIDWIYVRTDPTRVSEASDAINEALVAQGRLPLIYTNTLWSIFTKPELDGYISLHDAFAGVFLASGLLVLANVMLLSARRRRKEIALRRAEGATRGDVFRQFLWEGVLVGICGLVLGCIAGMALAWLRVRLEPGVAAAFTWPWDAVLRATWVLVLGALAASTYPAWRAAGQAPMTLFRRVA